MRNAAALERSAFAPPPTSGMIRSLLLAIAAHGLLLAFLAAGVQWHRETPPVVAEAELWSAVPEMAAPPPAPEPDPTPVAEPPPPPVVEQTPPTPAPDIALEKERKRKEQLALQEKADKAKALRDKAEKEKLEKLKREKLEQAKQEQLAKEKKLQAERKQPDPKNTAEARKLEELRQQNLKRMMGQAGSAVGNGNANASGSAAQASGPSAGYAGRINARIKPNIVYIETIVGNPTVEIEVRTSPDGTIISRKITKASGVSSWDEAALKAIDKTEVLPRNEEGRVPSPMTIVLSPQVLIGR